MYKSLGIFGVGEILVSILAQIDAMPDSLISIFAQIPLVAVIVFLWIRTDKNQREDKEKDRLWLEHMLELQRASIKETYESSQNLEAALIGQIVEKQNDMLAEIKNLTGQIGLNTATVNEVAKVESLASDLIDRLERK